MSSQEVVDDILTHYGAKGMKWGVRKDYRTSTLTSSSSTIKGLDKFPKETASAVNIVNKKMNKAYGFKVDNVIPLSGSDNKRYLAYVEYKNNGSTAIHMTTDSNLKNRLLEKEREGMFVPSGGKVIEANITHEAAHAMFHTINLEGKSLRERAVLSDSMTKMRKSAWNKSKEQAISDGDAVPRKGPFKIFKVTPEFQMMNKLSKYAASTLFLEEHEAEMFAAYHWSPNPPKFVDAFMNDIHTSMGKKVQPFSGRKVSNA